jgi:hypothetical protein
VLGSLDKKGEEGSIFFIKLKVTSSSAFNEPGPDPSDTEPVELEQHHFTTPAP